MGRADSDKAGGSGNTGGRGGSSGGGGTGGGVSDGRGNNTPGHPDNPGRRGNTKDGRGNNTPGHPNNPNRIGNSDRGPGHNTPGAPGTDGRRSSAPAGTPAARARDAMTRRAGTQVTGESGGLMGEDATLGKEVADKVGMGTGYSHTDAIAERAKEGMVSPREADIARGYDAGKTQAMAEQSVGGLMSGTISQATGLPGVGKLGNTALGQVAGSVPSTPETGYGRTVGYDRASNTAMQSVGQTAAGVVGGPVGARVAGAVNTAINDQRTKDIDRMSAAMGFGTSTTPNTPSVGGGNAGTPAAAASAMNAPKPSAPTMGYAGSIDMDAYGRGLLSVAQNT